MVYEKWDDLDISEKIERMKNEIKLRDNRINALVDKINKLENHEHINNKLYIPYILNIDCSEKSALVEKWF